MIIGVGTDLVEIVRVKEYLEGKSGHRFAERVLTPGERMLAASKGRRFAEFTAGRFAAKEAVVKALGTGIGAVTGFQDIEVLPGPLGRPEAVLSAASLKRLGYPAEDLRIHVSITHTAQTASAYAVAELVSPVNP